MKVVINEEKDTKIEVRDKLEPNYVTYSIEQGDNKIKMLGSEARDLVKALEFLLKNNEYEVIAYD